MRRLTRKELRERAEEKGVWWNKSTGEGKVKLIDELTGSTYGWDNQISFYNKKGIKVGFVVITSLDVDPYRVWDKLTDKIEGKVNENGSWKIRKQISYEKAVDLVLSTLVEMGLI